MNIIGLFVVVFSGLLITSSLGLSETAQMIGCVIGAGTFILMRMNS
jgi:hypothetical protein